MPTTTAPAPDPAAAPSAGDPPLVPMYTEILRAGILEGARVYLWNGRLAPRMTTGRPHTISVLRTFKALDGLGIPGVYAEPEQPMAFRLEHTAPYPDVKLVRGRPEDYPHNLPTTADVPLVVEIVETTMAEARSRVIRYAREGIPVYWIVNLIDRVVEVYARVGADAYGAPARYAEDAEVPVVVDGTEAGRLRIRDLLP